MNTYRVEVRRESPGYVALICPNCTSEPRSFLVRRTPLRRRIRRAVTGKPTLMKAFRCPRCEQMAYIPQWI